MNLGDLRSNHAQPAEEIEPMSLLDDHVRMMTKHERRLWAWGFDHCLDTYSIWDNGVQRIGCLRKDIREVREELRKELEELEESENQQKARIMDE